MSNVAFSTSTLSGDTEVALREMIGFTKASINAFEAETNAMALGDDFSFTQVSTQKKEANTQYQIAAREFMERKDEFVGFGGNLVEELKNLQSELKSLARINMNLLEPLLPPNSKAEK
ncbi:MAG: hypothetical protein ACRBDL_04250 [Alphaproteobacteria bacterium]